MQEKKKQRRKKWKRTHYSCAIPKGIAYDICVAGHKTLPSNAIKAISIDCARHMRRVNRNTSSKGILVQACKLDLTIYKITKKKKKMRVGMGKI